MRLQFFNHLSDNPTKWSNALTIRWQQPTNCFSVFDHFVRLALKGFKKKQMCFTLFFFQECSSSLLSVISFPAFAVEDTSLIQITKSEIIGRLQVCMFVQNSMSGKVHCYISSQCSYFIPPEHTGKVKGVFWGGIKWSIGQNWVTFSEKDQ